MNPYWVPTTTRFPFSLLLDNETWFIGARSKLDPLFPDVFHFGRGSQKQCLLCHCANLQFTICESKLREFDDVVDEDEESPVLLFSRKFNKVVKQFHGQTIPKPEYCDKCCNPSGGGKLVAVRASNFKPPDAVVFGGPSEKAQTAVDLAFGSGESVWFVSQLAKATSGSGNALADMLLYFDSVGLVPGPSVKRPKSSAQTLKAFVCQTIACYPSIANASFDVCERYVFEASQIRMRSSILFSKAEIRETVRNVVGKSYFPEMDLPSMMKRLTVSKPRAGVSGIGAELKLIKQYPRFKPVIFESLVFPIWKLDNTLVLQNISSEELTFSFAINNAAYLQLLTSNVIAACRQTTMLTRIHCSCDPEKTSLQASEVHYEGTAIIQQSYTEGDLETELQVSFVLEMYSSSVRSYTAITITYESWGQTTLFCVVFDQHVDLSDVQIQDVREWMNEYIQGYVESAPFPLPTTWYFSFRDYNEMFGTETEKVNDIDTYIEPSEFLSHPTVTSVVMFYFLCQGRIDWYGNDPEIEFADALSQVIDLLTSIVNGRDSLFESSEVFEDGISSRKYCEEFRKVVKEDILTKNYSFGELLRRSWALFVYMHPYVAGSYRHPPDWVKERGNTEAAIESFKQFRSGRGPMESED